MRKRIDTLEEKSTRSVYGTYKVVTGSLAAASSGTLTTVTASKDYYINEMYLVCDNTSTAGTQLFLVQDNGVTFHRVLVSASTASAPVNSRVISLHFDPPLIVGTDITVTMTNTSNNFSYFFKGYEK